MSNAAHRLIDANYNRAREALRTIEDIARFAHDDQHTAARAKVLRHQLRDILTACDPTATLAARDITSDVGRDTKTSTELARAALDDIAAAAFARLTESLRVLSETAKLVAPAAATPLEQIRYAAYELEQRLRLRAARAATFRAAGLYVLLTESLCTHDWQTTAADLLAAGVRCLQLREKSLPDDELLRRARWLRDQTRAHDALLIINDRPDIACLAAADGLHLGQDDLSVDEARHIVGGDILIGKSTHTPDQFRAAAAEHPDYLAVGPMLQSTTKPQNHIAGLETLAAATPTTALPVVAIGGITTTHVPELITRGATLLCVCSAVVSAPDPGNAAREFLTAIASAQFQARQTESPPREIK